MYTIKEAAVRTGVTIPLLRAWERRYGIVRPVRTPGGYRTYDEVALERIRAMRRLVDEGWSPSAAAAAILARPTDHVAATQANPNPPSRSVATSQDHALLERFVEAAGALDGGELEGVLDEMFAAGTFERVAGDHLTPALRALGDAWSDGRVDVAGEHLASNAVFRRLSAAFQAAGSSSTADHAVIVGLPPGARHELGGMMFATAARRAGLPVLYLGADLPIPDWLAAADRVRARAAVIGVPTARDRSSAVDVAAALRERRPGLVVALGGIGAPAVMSLPGPGPTVRLPEEIQPAVTELRAALERVGGG